ACHGTFEPKTPGASGIVLAGAERLTLRDITSLDLQRIRVAFLASCWSADNFVSPGRWIVSLPYALLGAGVQTVVGSLWEVLDEVSVLFAQEFYERLQAGIPSDEALRQALQVCRRRPTGEQRPLWDWAGFVLTGVPSPVRWGRA